MAKHCIYSVLLSVAVFVLLPAAIHAQSFTPPHINDPFDGSECMTCHKADASGFGLLPLPRGADQEQLCKTCHNPSGSASSTSNVANHVVNSGATVIECSSCHDTHTPDASTDPHAGGQTKANLKLIRNAVRTPSGDLFTAIFQVTPAHYAFNEGNPPYNGICQACHTQTAYHRNDGTGLSHEPGTQCTGCHTHGSGFIATSDSAQ